MSFPLASGSILSWRSTLLSNVSIVLSYVAGRELGGGFNDELGFYLSAGLLVVAVGIYVLVGFSEKPRKTLPPWVLMVRLTNVLIERFHALDALCVPSCASSATR